MPTDPAPAARLAEICGGTLPSSIDALSVADQQHLVDAIDAAQARQTQALIDATERGLTLMPRPLRRIVSTVLLR